MNQPIHPLTPRAFLVTLLKDRVDAWLEANGSPVRVSGRIYDTRKDFRPDGWPFIRVSTMSEDVTVWATELTIADGDFLVRWVMKQDAIPAVNGEIADVEEFTAAIDGALQVALTTPCDPFLISVGKVDGIEIRGVYRPTPYGDEGQEVCEMGYLVRVVHTALPA